MGINENTTLSRKAARLVAMLVQSQRGRMLFSSEAEFIQMLSLELARVAVPSNGRCKAKG